MKANFTEHFFPWNEIFPWSSNKLYLLQKDFWENSFSYFFSDFKPNKEKVKYYFVDFSSIKGGEDDIFFLQIFCLLLDFFIFLSVYFSAWWWYFFPSKFLPPAGFLHFIIRIFLCLKMIFFPFTICASCWNSCWPETSKLLSINQRRVGDTQIFMPD